MVMAMKSDEKFDFVVFGASFNVYENVTTSIQINVYQKTFYEVTEMLGKPLFDGENLIGTVAHSFMLKSNYDDAVKKIKAINQENK
jgi:hypothetical protein